MGQRRRFIGAGAALLAAGTLVALPAFSSGATTTSKLRSFDAVTPRAVSANPRTEPPLHGTNPHAQGTAAVVNLGPSNQRPYSVDGSGSTDDEDIVIGRSRGEQRADGSYHGHITVASAFGNELIGRDTTPGQSVDEDLAGDLLDDLLCKPLNICLELVHVRSSTTSNSSMNSFSLARATLGGAAGVPGLSIGAAESVGNISSDGTCQTSTGGSQVADVTAATAVASVARSASTTKACRDAAPTQSNSSDVIKLGTTPLNLPLLTAAGCGEGTPDVETGLPPLLPIVCNADDSSATGGTQANAPYGVRNALDVYVLAIAGGAVAQVSAAQSESLAVAPAATTTTPTTTTTTPTTTVTTPAAVTPTPAATVTVPAAAPPANTGSSDGGATPVETGTDDTGDEDTGDDNGGSAPECSDGIDNDGDGKIDFGSDPGCSSADDDSEDNSVSIAGKELPFTGTDVGVLGLAGALLLAAGLALRGPARRRELGS